MRPNDSEMAEALAFALRGRAEVLLELSGILPKLSERGEFERNLSAWIRQQLDDVCAETELLAQEITDPQAVGLDE